MIDTELYSMFITLGPIVSAKIMRDKNSGYSFGYGFVQYENPADAAKATQQLTLILAGLVKICTLNFECL